MKAIFPKFSFTISKELEDELWLQKQIADNDLNIGRIMYFHFCNDIPRIHCGGGWFAQCTTCKKALDIPYCLPVKLVENTLDWEILEFEFVE